MTTTVQELLHQHPTNPVHETDYHTSSSKDWTKAYPPITKMNVHTRVVNKGMDGRSEQLTVEAKFDGPFLPEYDDDQVRFGERAHLPNYRTWTLSSEKDGHFWFHTEISNIALAAWAKYPNLFDAAEEKPHTDQNGRETVDTSYTFKHKGRIMHVAIGEFKRGLLNFEQWQKGDLTGENLRFSQELRA